MNSSISTQFPARSAPDTLLQLQGPSDTQSNLGLFPTAFPVAASLDPRGKGIKVSTRAAPDSGKPTSASQIFSTSSQQPTITTSTSKLTQTVNDDFDYEQAASIVRSVHQGTCGSQKDAQADVGPLLTDFKAPRWSERVSEAMCSLADAKTCSQPVSDEAHSSSLGSEKKRVLTKTAEALGRRHRPARAAVQRVWGMKQSPSTTTVGHTSTTDNPRPTTANAGGRRGLSKAGLTAAALLALSQV